MENSIEEAIKILEEFKTHGYAMLLIKYEDRNKANRKLDQAIEHILSDYKRVLKENEELKEDRDKFKKALGRRITYCNELEKDLFENGSNYVIPKQIVKDKIEELDKRIDFLNKVINEYEKECRQFKAFCKRVRRYKKHDVDLFNQGQEHKCNQFLNLISGEPHWSYEGKYFDDTDNQIKQYFERKVEEEK